MQSTRFAFELSAQELVDPKAAVSEPVEFDDLDTVLMPALPSANEPAPAQLEVAQDAEVELEAEDIDALLAQTEA